MLLFSFEVILTFLYFLSNSYGPYGKVTTNEQMKSTFFCGAVNVTSGCNKVVNFNMFTHN